ncbi:MAG: hypothetical protein NUV47_01775 [Patescibacteria group bacterium]|nr:hypothetical protein [Patescibacteria group bacterium]
MKNNNKNLVILVSLILLSVIAIISYVILYLDINKKNENIANISQSINNLYEISSTRVSLENIVTNTAENRQKILGYFVEKDGTAKFLESIEDLAKEHSLVFNVKSVGIADIAKNNASTSIALIDLQIETKGSWNDIMNFYSLLETLPYKTKFSMIQLEKDDVAPRWNGVVSFNVAILK